MRNVGKDAKKDGFFGDSERGVIIVRVRAVVDDPVHVEICFRFRQNLNTARRKGRRTESVEFRYSVLLDELGDERITFPVRSSEFRARESSGRFSALTT